jgi:hypothetical protein
MLPSSQTATNNCNDVRSMRRAKLRSEVFMASGISYGDGGRYFLSVFKPMPSSIRDGFHVRPRRAAKEKRTKVRFVAGSRRRLNASLVAESSTFSPAF